ncbi:MAG: tetratricopeptide repeat protein [Kiritimatiellia bacterium]
MRLYLQFVVLLIFGISSAAAWGQQAPAIDSVLEKYYSANALYNKKLYSLAVPEFEAFLKQNPTHAKADPARFGLALSYIGISKHAEAEPILTELSRTGKFGDPDQIAVLRAQCLMRLNRVPEAMKILEGVAGGSSKKHLPAALFTLTELSFQQGKWPETIQWADKLIALNSEDAAGLRVAYLAAYASVQLQKHESAIQRLNTLIPKLKDDTAMTSQSAFLLGESCRQLGRRAEAITAYTLALTNAASSAAIEIQFRIGMANMELGKPERAVEAFQQALTMKPAEEISRKITLYLGRALFESGDHKTTCTVVQPLTELKPSSAISAEASLLLARSLIRLNEPQKATAFLAQTIPLHQGQPLQSELYYEAGNLHMSAQRYAEASACFAAMQQQFPAWSQTNDLLRLQAVSLHHQKQYEASQKLCDDYLTRFPNDPLRDEVAIVRAENLFLLDRLTQAAMAFQEFATTDATGSTPDIARFRITLIHYKTNAWEKVIDAGEQLLQRRPKGDLFFPLPFLIGDAAFRLGQFEKAVVNLVLFMRQSATGKEENLDTALAEMGVARLKQARTNEALEQFSLLAQRFPQSRHTPLALSETGRLLYQRGDLAPARQALETLLAGFRDAPQRSSAEYYLGWIALAEKKNEDAARRFETVVTAYPKDPLAPDAALQRGVILFAMDDYAKAQAAFDQLLLRFPEHPRADTALFSKGISLARLKQWQNASTTLQQYKDKYPKAENTDRVLYELAWCEKGMNRQAEATKYYQALIDGYPKSELLVKSRTEMAELTFTGKDYDKTIADLLRSAEELKNDERLEEVMYRLGTAYFNKGDWANSAATFEKFKETVVQSSLLPSVSLQAGEARARMSDAAKALEHFAAAVKGSQNADPEKPAEDPKVHELALLRLSETHGLLSQWADAERTSALFLRLYPKSTNAKRAMFNNGWALESLKRYEDAIKQFRAMVSAKDKDVLSARGQFHIGECLYGLRKYDEAIVEFVLVQTNYRNEEWSAKASLEIGRVLEAKGELLKAQEQFKSVLKLYPKSDAAKTAKERLDGIRMSL